MLSVQMFFTLSLGSKVWVVSWHYESVCISASPFLLPTYSSGFSELLVVGCLYSFFFFFFFSSYNWDSLSATWVLLSIAVVQVKKEKKRERSYSRVHFCSLSSYRIHQQVPLTLPLNSVLSLSPFLPQTLVPARTAFNQTHAGGPLRVPSLHSFPTVEHYPYDI